MALVLWCRLADEYIVRNVLVIVVILACAFVADRLSNGIFGSRTDCHPEKRQVWLNLTWTSSRPHQTSANGVLNTVVVHGIRTPNTNPVF